MTIHYLPNADIKLSHVSDWKQVLCPPSPSENWTCNFTIPFEPKIGSENFRCESTVNFISLYGLRELAEKDIDVDFVSDRITADPQILFRNYRVVV